MGGHRARQSEGRRWRAVRRGRAGHETVRPRRITHPMSLPASSPLYLTPDLPGVGGRIKVEPADFEVEEVPAYEPAGTGDHLFLWVEKTDLGAEYFVRQVARRLGIPTGEVGTAGLKDRRAVTRQWVSVPVSCEHALPQLEGQ